MKILGGMYSPVVLSLLVVLAGGAVWSDAALSQTAGTWETTLIPISGKVSGQPESVQFSGLAKVSSKLAPDPDFNRPSLVISIDLSDLSGVGSQTRSKYVITGPENLLKKVSSWHQVEFTFPFFKSGSNVGSAQSGVASFALGFDTNTGAIMSASGNITSAALPR